MRSCDLLIESLRSTDSNDVIGQLIGPRDGAVEQFENFGESNSVNRLHSIEMDLIGCKYNSLL